MSAFDFPNAKPVALAPLQASFAQSDIEAEIKALTLKLWDEKLAQDAFDANVSGMAHLGSFELVRKSVNRDGLVLMQGDREESATRYLYRAWKSRNRNGRGIFFLRTYLQMLWPNACEVEQMWQEKAKAYPKALLTTEEVQEQEREADVYLTSRIDIAISFSAQPHNFRNLLSIISATVPARFVPVFSKVVAKFQAPMTRRAFYREIEEVTVFPFIRTQLDAEPVQAAYPFAVHEFDFVEVYPT